MSKSEDRPVVEAEPVDENNEKDEAKEDASKD